MVRVYSAKTAWSLLNGVCCLYKPRDVSFAQVRQSLRERLCADLNALEQPPIPTIRLPQTVENPDSGELQVVGEETQLDYSQHPLVIGPNYRPEDIEIESLHSVEPTSSGVTVVGINFGVHSDLPQLKDARFLSEYEVVGKLGVVTDDRKDGGKVRKKLTIDHVTAYKIRKLLTKVQEALYYEAKLTKLRKPWFTLELAAINESDEQILEFVHRLGISLEAGAVTAKLRRTRHGHFTLKHALLQKYWNLENILRNLSLCRPLLSSGALEAGTTVGSTHFLPPPTTQQKLSRGLRTEAPASGDDQRILTSGSS